MLINRLSISLSDSNDVCLCATGYSNNPLQKCRTKTTEEDEIYILEYSVSHLRTNVFYILVHSD